MAAAEFGRAISAHKEVRSKLYLCNNENIHTAESNQCAHRFQACNQFSAVERINCMCLCVSECVQQCTQTAMCLSMQHRNITLLARFSGSNAIAAARVVSDERAFSSAAHKNRQFALQIAAGAMPLCRVCVCVSCIVHCAVFTTYSRI